MKYSGLVANAEGLTNAVIQELKSQGVKAPKLKKSAASKQDIKQPVKLFGSALNLLPAVVTDDNGVAVPRFLVDLLLAIEKDVAVEGLFRKAGSVVRQKELRKNIENMQSWLGVQVHDIVSVMKQFFRELPEPLILFRYQDSLSKAQNLEDPGMRVYAIMLLCLLLPKENLDVMRYLMQFLHRVDAHSNSNRMNARNLAVVMTPNLTQLSEKADKCNRTLSSQTGVVETLIANADRIGMVPEYLLDKVEFPLLGQSDDELEKNGGGIDWSQKRKKRNSLNGVLSNFRRKNTSQPKTPTKQGSVSFTAVYACNTPTDSSQIQRTASKRKADHDPDVTPVIKKRMQEAYGVEVRTTPMPSVPHIFDLRSPLPVATGYTNAANPFGHISFIDGATTFKCANCNLPFRPAPVGASFPCQLPAPAGDSTNTFILPQSLSSVKEFFTPGWFIKKRNVETKKNFQQQALKSLKQAEVGVQGNLNSALTIVGKKETLKTSDVGSQVSNGLPQTEEENKRTAADPMSTKVCNVKSSNGATEVSKVKIVDIAAASVLQNTPSKMRKVSFDNKMDITQNVSTFSELDSTVQTPGISYELNMHLRIRTSEEPQRSPRLRNTLSRSLREKGSAPLVARLHGDNASVTPCSSLRRSLSTQSCDKLNRSALRRGRPNTRQTGLPEPSSFKYTPSFSKVRDELTNSPINPVDMMVLGTPQTNWLKDSDLFLEERKSVMNKLSFRASPQQQMHSSVSDIRKMSTTSMEDVSEKILASKLSESIFSLPCAAEFQFTLQKACGDGLESDKGTNYKLMLTDSQESLCSSVSHNSQDGAPADDVEDECDDMGNLALSEDEVEIPSIQSHVNDFAPAAERLGNSKNHGSLEFSTHSDTHNCKVNLDSQSVADVSVIMELPRNELSKRVSNYRSFRCNDSRLYEDRENISARRISERLKRKSSSFSYLSTRASTVRAKNKRRRSENDVKSLGYRDVVLAPLTNETYSILTNVGALTEASPTKEDIVEPLTDSTWRPAKDALSVVRDEVPLGGRPSLIMLKRQRAGMVSASVRKYDSISRSQCSTPKTMPSPSVRAPKSPVRVPSIFVRGSSTNNSGKEQQQQVRQSIRRNEGAAKIPLTGFVRRQSFNTKAVTERNNSGTRSAESSPTSIVTSKSTLGKPRPKSFSSPSEAAKRRSASPLKDINCQTSRIRRLPSANVSTKDKTSTPGNNPVFKTPTSQAPQSRLRTPRSASQSTVLTPGSHEKTRSPYRVVYQSLPRTQSPKILNDSAKKLTKQMSLNKI